MTHDMYVQMCVPYIHMCVFVDVFQLVNYKTMVNYLHIG